jgi:DNA ligase (NAD+)
LKELIELHGGKNQSGVSANTDFIVAGENMGPAKRQKAEKLGITILNEEEFMALISSGEAIVNEPKSEEMTPEVKIDNNPIQGTLF